MRTIAVGLGLLVAGCARSPSEWTVTRQDLPAPRVVRLPTRAVPPAPVSSVVEQEPETARPSESDAAPAVEVVDATHPSRIEPLPRPPHVVPRPVARAASSPRREGAPPCAT